jgi:DNA-binding NtrC family response regulator
MSREKQQSIAEEQEAEKTILVVEDDTSIGELVVQTLVQETPYQAVLVSDGSQALNAIHDIKPNLFILDYRLPDMSGIDLYDKLHTMQGLEDTPGIMISATLPKRELKQRALVGINKPFELSQLLDTVEKLVA